MAVTPPPKTMIPTAAPKAAPWLTPSVEALARGLLSTHCMTAPDMPSAEPTSMAATVRGRRFSKSATRERLSPPPNRVEMTSQGVSLMEPVPADITTAMASSTSVTRRASSFLRCRPSYPG